ncbi:MAG: helix-turn-helix domain-containing protein [Lachnospiraceae bacterium]|nr:helix-turn-helix domain-containing protein [Lachnospiraceae bacterium]
MISNVVLMDTLNSIKAVSKTDLTLLDPEGKVVATTLDSVSVNPREIRSFTESEADVQEMKGRLFLKAKEEYQEEYIIMLEADGENAMLIGKMATLQIESLLVAYREHYNRENFIKNLLLDNLLLVDIYNRAKKLHIQPTARRVVFILESEQSKDYSTLEAVKEVFSKSKNDFITAIDERSIIVIKELDEKDGTEELKAIGQSIVAAAGRGEEERLHVAYGNVINELKDVSRSYKEARMALDVGKIFFGDQNMIAYSQLGIGRLIYQLPIPLCKMFIREIFGDKNLEDFEPETFETINKFFENSLNVSETSRQLFVHRNTLVYRLDKLEKSTGLDLRVFDDAMTLKIALMVVQYMEYMETLEY